MSMEFLVRGASDYNEPGVFMAFEETAEELTQNVASLGFNLKELIEKKRFLLIMFVLNAVRLKRQANMILRVYLFALITRLIALAQNELF